ncbi:MAG: KOW domain-containing RNA-binding protein [Syntrophomonadaceae bacterium]|nr:KOW domain-containing RNA-binding protein [Syntrophomonadaceae bacterium]
MDDIIGRIVYSKAGRDKDRMFIVIRAVNDRYVVVADGDLRKIEKPKFKNIKHLQLTNTKAEDVIMYLKKGEMPDNHLIRKTLKKIREAREQHGKGV